MGHTENAYKILNVKDVLEIQVVDGKMII